ncbi:E3 ubiquitin-protein ligase UHRF1 [Podospora aff. communis PSN243]|uniref:E3 ubiquitin-protein ligase UHRF1 n=1 Tax=Podospora aff. communis PSN243 TaxID=3040156 RepID=A0AAV9G7Y4_9PEZI|nr:E3 ubiquitin-protein ligase UHRF1 [Podospora aff. communis PSN243]
MSLQQKSGVNLKRKSEDKLEGNVKLRHNASTFHLLTVDFYSKQTSKRPASSEGAKVVAMSDNTPESSTTPGSTDTSNPTTCSNATQVQVWDGSLEQGVLQIKCLYVAIKNGNANPEKIKQRKDSVRAFLFYLEHELGPSPLLQKHKVDLALELIKKKADEGIYPEDIAVKGADLFDRFEAENWGSADITEQSESEEETAPNLSSSTAQSAAATRRGNEETAIALFPPPQHPIWGISGIMHGLGRKVNKVGAYSYVSDPRYVSEKRDFKVFGDNQLQPGDWWPMQRLALFHGAHGSAGGGISGCPELGCWSIVIAGNSPYHGMDEDLGETVFYSGDSSLDNTNRERVDVISRRTRSLQASLRSGRPVRVLRSAGRDRAYAPKVGIRYDGLYRVVAEREKVNGKGGKYLQFELCRSRIPNQRDFAETIAAAPTASQLRDHARMGERW